MRLFALSIILFTAIVDLCAQCDISVTCRPRPPKVECSCEIPEINPLFLDFESNNNEDVLAFQALGFSVASSGNCGFLRVTANDRPHHPEICTDSFYIVRVYQIASVNGGIAQTCTDTFVTEVIPPYILEKINSFTITCEDNVDSTFQDFKDNHSYYNFLSCDPGQQVSYFPDLNPLLIPDCGGRENVRPQLNITGSCTDMCTTLYPTGTSLQRNVASWVTDFIVLDTFQTQITCPTPAPIDAFDPNLVAKIEDILDEYILDYSCEEPIISNNFVPADLLQSLLSAGCDPPDVMITISATEDCPENSNSCNVIIDLENNTPPEITFIPDTLFLECGEMVNMDLVNTWLARTRAMQYGGNTIPPSRITHNFDFANLNAAYCNLGFDITFVASDDCGRSDTGIGRIEINDTRVPEILACPNDTIVNADSPDLMSSVDSWIAGFQANDICNPNMQTSHNFNPSILAFNCGNIDTLITFIADDQCNPVDATACQAMLSIIDNVTDQFYNLPNDTIFQCENPVNRIALDQWSGNVSAGNSLGTTFLVSNDLNYDDPNFFSCTGSIDVEFSFVNQCGVETTTIVRIDITDEIAPQITCPSPGTFEGVFQDIEADITAWLGSAIPTDNCVASAFNNYSSILFSDCSKDTITNSITFYAQDMCNLRSTPCTADLTIIAEKSPSIICPEPLIIECGVAGVQDSLDQWLDLDGFNFVGVPITATSDFVQSNFDDSACLTSTPVTFTINDVNCSRSAECMTSIRVEDTQAPRITCPANITINTADQNATQQVLDWASTIDYNDNGCSTPDLFTDPVLDTIDFCLASTALNVTFTAVDMCGLQNGCVSIISYNNNEPAINCPPNVLTLECGNPNNYDLIDSWTTEANAADNSGFDLSLIVTNDFASILEDTCSQQIPVVFTVIDFCRKENSCEQRINLVDSTAPIVDCPTLPLNLLAGDTTKLPKFLNWLDLINVQECGGYSITENFDESLIDGFSCNEEDYDFIISFTDDCGWISTCQATISIQNNIQTTFVNCNPASNNITVECGNPDFEDQIIQWMSAVSAEDIFGNSFPTAPDLDLNDPAILQCNTTIPVNFELVDLCGNSQACALTLTIEDTTPPIAVCPQDTSFVIDDPDFTSNVLTWLGTITGEDDCISSLTEQSNYSPINSLPPCAAFEDHTIRFSILDGCGNVGTCESTLRVTTERVPNISCPPYQIVECGDSNNETTINQWLDLVTGQDADGMPLVPQYNFDLTEVTSLECDGTISILFEIEDACNITDTCSTAIVVMDTTPPVANCPPSISVNSTDPNGPASIQAWLDSFTPLDNCSIATGDVMNGFVVPNILCNSSENTVVEFYAEDFCGMRTTCESLITINKAAPEINCNSNLALQCGEGNNDQKILDWLASISGTDNHGELLDVNNNFTTSNFTMDCESSTSIEFTVSDACGVPTTCTQLIFQKDTIAPIITNCPSSTVMDIARPDLNRAIETWLSSFEAMDLCNSADNTNDYSLILDSFDCGSEQDVHFTAVDECGNVNATCQANISFENNLEVTITCPEPIQVKCNDPSILTSINNYLSDWTVVSEDVFVVENDLLLESLDIECTGPYSEEVTFTITDNCNNTDECSSSIEFIPNATIYIPNIFQPDLGGDDAYFAIRTNIAIETIKSFKVYSRWGDLMFDREDFDPNTERGWSGRNAQGAYLQGVYTYVIIYDDVFGNAFEEVGTITLL